jgi:hypothetical protein
VLRTKRRTHGVVLRGEKTFQGDEGSKWSPVTPEYYPRLWYKDYAELWKSNEIPVLHKNHLRMLFEIGRTLVKESYLSL